MKFCTKCGYELKEDQIVCPKCGNKVKGAENKPHETLTEANDNFNTKEEKLPARQEENLPVPFKAPLSKNKKIAAASVLVLIVLIGIFIYFGKSQSSPEKVVDNFKTAVNKQDKSEMEKLMVCNDSGLKIDDGNVAMLLRYFKNNPSYLTNTLSQLDNQALNTDRINSNSNLSSYILNVKRDGNKFLFFPNYKIEVKASYITVKTKIKDANIYINNTKVGTSTSDDFSKEYGPYIPGEYVVKGSYKGKYSTSNNSQDVDTVKATNNKISVKVLEDLKYVNVKSDNDDAEIFVNSEDTGKKVKDREPIGPIDNNANIYGVIEQDGKKLKSMGETRDSYGNSENADIYLNFADAKSELQSNENEVKSLVQNYITAFCSAVNYNDISYVSSYIAPASELYNEQVKYIPNAYSQNIKENNLSCDIVSCTFDNDNKSGTVVTHEVYDINNNGSDSQKTFDYKYTFKYSDKNYGYQLTSIANAK
ncbi:MULTISPECIES: zinc ribbon domain-containing protein [Clostridium]|uniref:zinc ribbon domain-containing protein n=1 Tax=Clostridium TaxID=1485 RepID=UPI0008270D89|nr:MULTISPECIES: zinc-ribbon domain-containing protein [Clostridium]PJI08766.1 zinc-ribbon domain-containing protein [Clostridium sp. CT7]